MHYIHIQALLLIGQWMEDTAYFDTSIIVKQYKVVFVFLLTLYHLSYDLLTVECDFSVSRVRRRTFLPGKVLRQTDVRVG